MSTILDTWCGPSVNLECRSELCCKWFAGNAGPKKSPKSRHLGTIAQLCRDISSQLRHVSTIGNNVIKQQYLPHMSSQYAELRPTSGWDLLTSLGHPCKFQRVSRLGSVTARHSSSGRQPTALLNRGRHLYSAWRPSHWALAHILVNIKILWLFHHYIFRPHNSTTLCFIKKTSQYIFYHSSGKSWWILIIFTFLKTGMNALTFMTLMSCDVVCCMCGEASSSH